MIKNKRNLKISSEAIFILLEVGLFALLLFIDLFSKGIIMPFLKNNGLHFPMIEGVFELQYAENYGATFGIFTGKPVFLIVITSITTIAMLTVLVLLNGKAKLLRFGLVTIIAGAVGNLVDRIALGYVRDFIDYTFLKTWFNIDFAIGNIADIFCLVGVLMLIVYLLLEYEEGDLSFRFESLNKKLCKKVK